MSRQTKPIPAVVAYAQAQSSPEEADLTPIIKEVFRNCWTRYPFRKRLSRSWARKLKAEGYTTVSVEVFPSRHADFRIEELLRVPRQPKKVPASAGTR